MTKILPRYEFRAFAQNFGMVETKLRQEIFPAFGVAEPPFQRKIYTLQEYLDEIIFPHPQLTAVSVFKHRFAYTVNGCITEIANLLINGAAIQTVAVEHTDVPAILKAKTMLDLQEYENVNYLRAIKRIIALEPLPA